MRKQIFAVSAALFAGLLLTATTFYVNDNKDQILIKLIMDGLNKNHYSTSEVDDDFSTEVYDLYLKRMDYGKRFLTQVDVDKLSRFRYKLDNQVNNANYDFFDLSVEILERRTNQAQEYYREILAEPFDLSINEEYQTDVEKQAYAEDKDDLRERWRRYLKYRTLDQLYTLEKEQEKAIEKEEEDLEVLSFEEMEAKARKKVLKQHDNWFKRLNRLDETDRRSTYLNAITNVFDPHTGYFPPRDKEDFDISISGRLEGIGATLQDEDGYVKVVRIVPGGPAFKQGELESGDKILKVGQGEEEAVDIVDMGVDHAVKLIRGKKGSIVRLSVKKIDNSITEIVIVRDIVVLEDTYARSAMLKEGKGKKDIGYIHLPKFYTDFTRTGGRTCAVDVREEVQKLKREGVEGIILDLRNNGGGSLNDVVQMAGLFIEDGPIVQIKGRRGALQVLEDRDPRLVYDGPLVIMVNNFSASASEILAAAIQDYERGVIIGSASTFGKGTVQRFVNLDRFVTADATGIKPLGSMKYTTQKFYRIDGGATQLKGVIPDIILPDAFTYVDVGEKEREHSMEWDEIAPVPFRKWKGVSGQIEGLRTASEERIEANPTFARIAENAQRNKRLREESKVSLSWKDYKALEEARDTEAETFKELQKKIEGLTVATLAEDMAAIEGDTNKIASMEDFQKRLQKDTYLYEALQVIRDLD